MKIVLTLISVLILSSCSIGAKFDNNEYASLVRVEVIAKAAIYECNNVEKTKVNLGDMRKELDFVKTYSLYLDNNNETVEIISLLDEMVNTMTQRYYGANNVPSELYCKQNMIIIVKSTQRTLEAISKKAK